MQRPVNNVFIKRQYAPNVPAHVKKALGSMKLEGPEFDVLVDVCDELSVQYQHPGIIGDAAVHFALPDYKVAIQFVTTNRANIAKKSMTLTKQGWKLIMMKPTDITVLPRDQVREQLRAALSALKSKRVK
jgi:hypothetical protein